MKRGGHVGQYRVVCIVTQGGVEVTPEDLKIQNQDLKLQKQIGDIPPDSIGHKRIVVLYDPDEANRTLANQGFPEVTDSIIRYISVNYPLILRNSPLILRNSP